MFSVIAECKFSFSYKHREIFVVFYMHYFVCFKK